MDAARIVELIKTIIGVLGILGNGLVCVVIAKVPAMRTLTNAFVLNQAVIDFLGSLVVIVTSNYKPDFPLHDNVVIAVLQCYIARSTFTMWILFVTSTFNLVMLTSERYVAIVHPFKYLAYFGRKQATFMLLGVWIFAFGYKIHIVLYRQIVDGQCILVFWTGTLPVVDGVFSFLIQYLIPLVFMTFCYIHIILQLKKASSNVAPESTTSQQGDNSMSGSLLRARRNTLKTLFIVFVSYTICWSPNQFAFLFHNLGLELDFKGAFYYITIVMVQLNSCINPIIYAFKYKQFQSGVRALFKPCCSKPDGRHDQHPLNSVNTKVTAAHTEENMAVR